MENLNKVRNTVTQDDIIHVIKLALSTLHPDIKPRKALKLMVFNILKTYYLEGKKYVIAECPTGSGKTIIGFVSYFCIQMLEAYLDNHIDIYTSETIRINLDDIPDRYAYFLTSNKALQEQIQNDIDRFDFEDYMMLLKGVNNYKCIEAHNRYVSVDPAMVSKVNNMFAASGSEVPKDYEVTYNFRPCAGYSREQLIKRFPKCFDICPYKVARLEASDKSCTILNYAYFLNVMRLVDINPNTFFPRRKFTICDEAHLIPDIVCNMFNFELTDFTLRRIESMIEQIIKNYGIRTSTENYHNVINGYYRFFYFPIDSGSNIIRYFKSLFGLVDWLKQVKKEYNSESFNMMFGTNIMGHIETLETLTQSHDSLVELIQNRPEDLFFESEVSRELYLPSGKQNVYKHTIKDLRESEMIQKNFLDKIEFGLFMSATLGDIREYASMMGIEEGTYKALCLPSTFDFSRSPIYLTKSGWLNYKNFNTEIFKVLNDCLTICNRHQTEKGLIHTGTFKVTSLLKDAIYRSGNKALISRFLFYSNAKEKEAMLETFRNSTEPYILCGPSLYEGIDLPDDLCRFQILVKAPYAQINSYIKKKMQRYPFWYKRNCLEKIVQAIGRSNRHKDDWSVVYLLDNCFDSLIFDTGEAIINRLSYRRV